MVLQLRHQQKRRHNNITSTILTTLLPKFVKNSKKYHLLDNYRLLKIDNCLRQKQDGIALTAIEHSSNRQHHRTNKVINNKS